MVCTWTQIWPVGAYRVKGTEDETSHDSTETPDPTDEGAEGKGAGSGSGDATVRQFMRSHKLCPHTRWLAALCSESLHG